MQRLPLLLPDPSYWLRLFDPRGGGLFVPTLNPPNLGTEVRIDLTITEGGPRVILRGNVLWRRTEEGRDPAGCLVALPADEREKINFINGFVRGGLINRRERRRLPLRLAVSYTSAAGAGSSWSRDFNEEGIFVLADRPLAEGAVVGMTIRVPGHPTPLSVSGTVTHTVLVEDEDVPGMGIRFNLDEKQATVLATLMDELEAGFYRGALPDEVIS
ncbi:MAG: PilZ domain-containing protein [Pseudomonadota bacterium]